MDKLQSLVLRVFFAGAFALVTLAIAERVANVLGYTLLGGVLVPSRLLEVSAAVMIFVIALELRQIRDRLASGAR